jgi:hypothetical protein
VVVREVQTHIKIYQVVHLKLCTSWAWWYASIISALGKLRQEDHKFETSLGYVERPCLKKQKQGWWSGSCGRVPPQQA